DDAFKDSDNDGLSNLREWQEGLDPQNDDEDNDGLLDGWEVKNGLNVDLLDPSGKNGANGDKDGDFIKNKYEYDLGWDPNRTFDKYIAYIIIILVIVLPTTSLIIFVRVNNQAKHQGFNNYRQRRRLHKLGFEDPQAEVDANQLGFLTSEARNLVQSYGVNDTQDLIQHWRETSASIKNKHEKIELEVKLKEIDDSKTPIKLSKIEQEYDTIIRQLSLDLMSINRIDLERQALEEMIDRSRTEPFSDITLSTLSFFESQFKQVEKLVLSHKTSLEKKIQEKKEYFAPWGALLSLIQVTGDGIPVDLTEIVQITNTSRNHAEELIQVLLSEFPLLGQYNPETHVYTKGTDLDEYLRHVLENLADAIDRDST
ncbi:MAG: hypothetical protein ACXAD7_18905, partial [Candidatus Kariarchaeaceae archaeon]